MYFFQARSCEWFWGCGLTPLLHETHKKGTKTRQYAIKRLKILLKKVQNYGFAPPPKNVNVYPNSSYSNLLNRISPMVCLITVNNFMIALEAGIPRNSHNFNGMGQILRDIGMTPLKFNGYRNLSHSSLILHFGSIYLIHHFSDFSHKSFHSLSLTFLFPY